MQNVANPQGNQAAVNPIATLAALNNMGESFLFVIVSALPHIYLRF